MQVTWIVEECLLERHDEFGFPNVADAAVEAGHQVIRTKYVPFTSGVDEEVSTALYSMNIPRPVVTYGCIGFLKQINRHPFFKKMCPGAYYRTEELRYSKYSHIWGDLMLNNDYVILPYGEIIRRIEAGDLSYELFIRPDVVTKSFAGRVIDFLSISENPAALSQYDPIDHSELCVIAEPKEIQGEYRHVICNHELIAQSQYRYDGKLDIRIDVHPECQRLAKEISRHEWQPDTVYVVDTCLLPSGEPRIVEYNTFSCSGLYAADTRNIVKHVSFAAQREFTGDLD